MSPNLNLCFTKIKSPPSPEHSPPIIASRPLFIKNFNSLYVPTIADEDTSDSDVVSSFAAATPLPDLSAAFASQRFFISSPGRSNSIVDSTTPSFASTMSSSSAATTSAASSLAAENDPVKAVPTYSPDPYADFRRSMQEMVDARELHDVRESWDYLHELLICYLSLNPKSTHKFVIAAFADVIVGLMTSSSPGERRRRTGGFPAVDLIT